MVQQFSSQPVQTQWSNLGQGLGQGLAKRIGLSEAENAAQTAGGDPVKLAFALAQASTYAPELQRSLGDVYKQLLTSANQNAYAGGLPKGGQQPGQQPGQSQNQPGITNNPGQMTPNDISPEGVIPPSSTEPSNTPPNQTEATIPPKPSGKYSANDVKNSANQFVADLRPDLIPGSTEYGRVPTFNYQAKSDLRPEEEQQLRQQLIDRKTNPNVINDIVDNVRNDIKTRYAENLRNFGFDKERQEAVNNKWNAFAAAADKNLEPIVGKYSTWFGSRPKTAEAVKNKYLQYAGDLSTNLTPAQMHAQAATAVQNDVNRLNALEAIPGPAFIRDAGEMSKYLANNKEAYKQLNKEGFYEALKEDAAAKDLGLEELHYTIWGDQTDKGNLNAIGELPAPKMYSKGHPHAIASLTKPVVNPKYTEEREKYIGDLSNRLQKIKPEDDLILLRGQALNQGATVQDFNDALTAAQGKKLKLSPFQQSQIEELMIPRSRPIWEIFNPKAYASWINEARGKR